MTPASSTAPESASARTRAVRAVGVGTGAADMFDLLGQGAALDEGTGEGGRDVTVGFVADRLAVDPSRASRIVADAVKSGFVRRVASQEDGRRSCLELTGSGEQAVAAAHRTRQGFYASLLGDWEPGEQREFARLLTKFVRSLDEAERG
ncbi:MarR family winged helix-turn-helix transcriptional regulator [Streptomyces albidoflavus]|uniref:MarR family winged helix-turn-helix transcriptional regulator n=1 Tax=Streptomyces albidoflavus TaxID=1886 RepID=UPI003F4D4B11